MKNLDEMERYNYLIQARNYHYTNFNIWMAFFTVIIGAVFAGYCSLLTNPNTNTAFEQNLLLLLGYTISLFWHWSCKGYYYWITNFIKLLWDCEKNLADNDRVYSCFANKNSNNNYCKITKGANISTSTVVCAMSFFVAVVWAVIFIYKMLPGLLMPKECAGFVEFYAIPYFVVSMILAIAVTLFFNVIIPKRKCFNSDIDNLVDLKL